MRDSSMNDLIDAASSAGVVFTAKTLGFAGVAGVAAGAVAISLTLPTSKNEFFCRLVVTVLTSIFIGPLAVEWLNLTNYSIHSQIGVCFIAGVPSWLVWSYFIKQLEKAQKKTPAQLAKEAKQIKDNFKGD